MIDLRPLTICLWALLNSTAVVAQSMAPVPLDDFRADHLGKLKAQEIRSLISRPNQLEAIVEIRPGFNYSHHSVEPGESYSSILGNAGLNADQRRMFRRLTERHDLLPHPGDLVVLGYNNGELREAWLWQNDHQALKIRLVESRLSVHTVTPKFETRVAYVFGYKSTDSFSDSLNTTNLPRATQNQYLDLFSGQAGSLDTVPQGSFYSLVFEQVLIDRRVVGVGRLLIAGLNEETVVRYKDYTGVERYFDATGQPQTAALLRKPVNYTRISSHFNPNRRHPILDRFRPHNGVDYAAPSGSEVVASGRGRVRFVGTSDTGYGKLIVISHPDGLKTKYAHLSGFADGLERGDFVEQGETIGYVGSSGLATGPHLHFEIITDGTPVNPLTAQLPTAEPLSSLRMRRFEGQTTSIFARLARLNRFSAVALQYRPQRPTKPVADYRNALLASLSGDAEKRTARD